MTNDNEHQGTSQETGQITDSRSGFQAERTRRLSAIDELKTTGVNPYPYRFDRTHTLGELREKFAPLEPGK